MLSFTFLPITSLLVIDVVSHAIDNSITGQPVIHCSSRSISIGIEMEKPFNGSVYVRGFFHIPGCRFKGNLSATMTVDIPVTSPCGVRRQRMANQRGLALDTTIVVMFHPIFVTKVDKAYHVHCQYLETNSNVTRKLEVKTLSPTELPLSIVNLDKKKTPTCKYEVLRKNKKGAPVQLATIGDIVYHKYVAVKHQKSRIVFPSWTCESDDRRQYCMTVHSCSADDGEGNGQRLIDENGCSLDLFLLKNLEYGKDLIAGQKAYVFKFADKPTIFFSCVIRLEFKQDPSIRCKNPTDYCTSAAHDAMISEATKQPDEISEDFPRPPIADFNRKIFYKNFQYSRKHVRILRATTRNSLDVDVTAPSVEVLEFGTEKRPCLGDAKLLSDMQICVPRLWLGLTFSAITLTFSVGLCLLLRLSSRIQQDGSLFLMLKFLLR